MLLYDPSGRIDPIHIVSHPWVTGFCKERPDLVELMSKCTPPSVKEVLVQVRNSVVCVLGLIVITFHSSVVADNRRITTFTTGCFTVSAS